MTITITFVTVWRRLEYLAEKVMYSDHYKRISFAIQLENAASIRGTFPDSAILSEIIVL
jgi:hypothetical protein